MNYKLLTPEEILDLHDRVLNTGELKGVIGGKSVESPLSRIESRTHYGMIEDVFHLAAMYAVAISQAHVFCDANKRTAYAALLLCLKVNGASIKEETEVVGDMIREVAQGNVDEYELARWLRKRKVS